MKKPLVLLTLFTLALAPALAQTTSGHSVTLNWAAGSDDTGFNVYRASGACPASVSANPLTTGFAQIASLTSATPASYEDTSVKVGTYCYFVTGTAGGAESVPSNTANPSVLPFPATGLTVTVK